MSDVRVIVPLAEGVEEMEAVIVIDVLRRAGAEVAALGLDQGEFVTASRGVRLGVDGKLSGDEDASAIVLPGGAGAAERLAADERVKALLRRFEQDDKWIGAICAAPIVLVAAGVGAGKTMTSHPSVRDIVEPFAGPYVEDSVALDPKILSSRGPGTSFDFALNLVGLLFGVEKASEVRTPMVFC
ncbi:MAG: DJ-1 family protein [Planctomycetota bacterium]|nr:MAG: DJ-1 family protein [Planctomycetota bacterium]